MPNYAIVCKRAKQVDFQSIIVRFRRFESCRLYQFSYLIRLNELYTRTSNCEPDQVFYLCSGRLMVRSLPSQGKDRGSIPRQSTKQNDSCMSHEDPL